MPGVLVLNLLWRTPRCSGTARERFVLDTAFVLIEGHPAFAARQTVEELNTKVIFS